MGESRVVFLEQCLSNLGYDNALRAMDWMMEEMSANKGFVRHDGSHYYYHLIDTTQDLFNHGIKNEDILIAMLAHDAAEDIPGVTIRMIEDKFNSNVATMVDFVTKKKGVDYKSGDVIDVSYLRPMLQNVGSCLLKASDRKHNFSTLRDATPEKRLRQAVETEKYFIPFFKEARNKYPRYAGYFYSAKTAIEPHLWAIKDHHEEITRLKEEFNRQLNNK